MRYRTKAALGAALMTMSVTAAQAATIVNTGAGTAAPNSAPIVIQMATAAQFTLTKQTMITGIEIFGNVLTGSRIGFNFSTSSNDTAPNPINVIYYREGIVSATNGQGAWVGLTNLTGITLDPGTYWTQNFSDGILDVVHYGSSPNPLGNEARYVNGTYLETDDLNLSWRISGTEIEDAPVTPVPEPAAWAMMIAGFAVVAYQLRQRRVLFPA